MKKSMKVSSSLLSVVLLASTLGTNVYAEGEIPLVTQELETDQVIVTFKEDVTSEMTELDVVSVKTLDTEDIATLKVPEGETVETFIEELEARKDIESVEPDHLVQLTYTPNDPYFNYYQYHHKNIETERAWDKTMGSSDIVVAVLDSGFDLNHSDLVNQFVSPASMVSSGFSVDDHGTHVAGIIGSSADNYAFGSGVAPKTSIMPIDVFEGKSAYLSDVTEGIYQAVGAGADIINMSLGTYSYSYTLDNAVQYAYQNGLVIIASSGNDASAQKHYPSSFDNVISVGSTDSANNRSYFSNYGTDLDIVAPGSSIYSTLPYGGFNGLSGTSMASPVVAGVAALVLANEPHLTNAEVVDRLLTTTKDLGDYGKDSLYGNGLVNAKQAVKIMDIPSPTAFSISDSATVVSGYVLFDIQNGTIIVRDQSGNTIGTQENYNGYTYFNVAIPQQTAGTTLYVSAKDSYGNESEAAEVSVWDGTAPEKPVVHEVTDQSTSIKGSAEPNTVLTVLANDNIIDTAWVDGNGNFERPIERLAAGTKLSLNVMDDAGNISESTEVTVKDATAPAKPKVNEVTENTVKVTGTAEAGSTVTVKAKGVLLDEAVADENSNYSIAIAKQKAGTLLTITSTDQAGNVSEATEIKVKDNSAPAMPTVSEVTDKSTTVKGTAEAKSSIIVKAGTAEIGKATANSDGSFAVTITKQKAGTKLSITAADASGNISAVRGVTVLDATAPAAPTVDPVTDKSSVVTGAGEVNASISVKAGDKELGTAKVAADGKFKVAISAQKAGTKIQVTATDAAGNKSAVKEVSVTDGTPPATPTVNEVTDKSTVITGAAETDSAITVKAGDKLISEGKTDESGNFSLAIEKQQAGVKLAITSADAAGNVSGVKEITVSDATAPAKPVVDKVTDKTVSITGKAEAGSVISVKADATEIGNAIANQEGNYAVAIKKQTAGTMLKVTAADKAGNISLATPVTVLDETAPALSTVAKVTDKSTSLEGTAEVDSVVVVKAAGVEIGKGTTASDGKFVVAVAKQKAGTKLSVTATDMAGNISTAKEVTVLDATAPNSPTVDKVTDKSTSVTGSGEVNAAITVTAGSKELGTASVSSDGKYKVAISAQKAGMKIQVTATDAVGNVSSMKEVTVTDGTAPAVPTVNKVTDKSTAVAGTAEAAAQISVKAGNNELATAPADADGKFSVSIPKQKAGTKLTLTAKDAAGNVSEAKEITVLDTTAPELPTVEKVTDKSTSVKGSAEANTSIFVKTGDKELGKVTAGATGLFEVTIEKQKAGTVLTVTAADVSGNVSSPKEVMVSDATAPASPTVDKVSDETTTVTGTGEADSFISVKSEGKELGTGTVGGDGNYKVAIAAQKAGTKIQVTATDAAGNISMAKETDVVDAAAPDMPTANKVTDQATAVTGTAEAASEIIIKVGSKQIGTATVNADGKYSAAIPKQKAGTVLAITAMDKEGNVSEMKEITVADGTAPAVTLTNKVTHHSTRVIGTAEAKAEIVVKAGTKAVGEATTDAKGKYEVTIAKQKVGTKLSIVATDATGNSSKAISVTVVDGNYPDLKLRHWALDEIMYLADDQIIGGYPNGGFQPEKNTTRAEAAKMLALALDLPIVETSSGYKDVSSKHWAKDYIAAVSKAGLFNGNPDGTFAPNDVLKRAEMAKVISIAYDLNSSNKNHFNDVKAGHWAKGYISGLYENGITTGFPDKTFRPGASTTRAEYSVFLARALNEDFR